MPALALPDQTDLEAAQSLLKDMREKQEIRRNQRNQRFQEKNKQAIRNLNFEKCIEY